MPGAGLWPVVQRELRETARRPLNHWLRLGGAFVGVVMFCSVTADVPDTVLGTELFTNIHLLLLCLICAIVPALTADCIARERREGTLGLLFMTPLTASGIVVGKVLAQVLRALTLWLAVMPLLAIPFLYGGVTWTDIAILLTIEFCAGLLCLAAGILASSLTDNRAIAFILAFLLMGAFVGGARQYQNQRMRSSARASVLRSMSRYPSRGSYFVPKPSVLVSPAPGVVVTFPSNYIVFPRTGTRFPTAPRIFPGYARGGFVPRMMPFGGVVVPMGFASSQPPPGILAEDFCIAAMVLLISIRFAGFCVERSWQDKIPSVRRQGLVKRYCSPVFKDWFARSMRRALERNPIAWLQQYSWKARVSKWGLCLLFVFLESSVINGNDLEAVGRLLTALVLIMVAAYTFAGVNGFLQEKKSGALELILVSPISVNQIISGRVRGLWKQFLPSALVLVGSDVAFHEMIGQHSYYYGDSWATGHGGLFWNIDFEIAAIYLTLPVVATCFALTSKNLFVASALTVAIVFGPAALMLFPGLFFGALRSLHLHGVVLLVLQVLLALAAFPVTILAAHGYSASLAYRHLQRSLGRRGYAY